MKLSHFLKEIKLINLAVIKKRDEQKSDDIDKNKEW